MHDYLQVLYLETTMANELQNCTVALLIAPRGTEQIEVEEPKQAVEDAGGHVEVIGAVTGKAKAVNSDLEPGDSFDVDRAFSSVSPDQFDALIVPGGTIGADILRANSQAVTFIRGFFDQAKPVGVICHGPWTLVEADVVRGRTLTSFPSLKTDIRNAGGTWVDEEVVTYQGLVTSRGPDDLPIFCARLVDEFARGKERQQASGA